MRVFSGVPNLDVAGGLPRGITHLYGEDGTFLLDAAYYLAQHHTGPVYWICGMQAEQHELEAFAEGVVRFRYAEQGYEAAGTCLDTTNALVVIESLPAMQAYAYEDSLEVEDMYEAQHKLTAHALYMLKNRCVSTNSRVLLLNEARWSREYGKSYHLRKVIDGRVDAHIQTKYGHNTERYGSRLDYSVKLLWNAHEKKGADHLHFFGENYRPMAWQYLKAMMETGGEVTRQGSYYKYLAPSGIEYQFGPGKRTAAEQLEEMAADLQLAYRKTRSREHGKIRSDDRPEGERGAGHSGSGGSGVQGRGGRFRRLLKWQQGPKGREGDD